MFIRGFHALQLIVLKAFGAIGLPLASCMMVNFSEIHLKWQLVCKLDIMLFSLFFYSLYAYIYLYILIFHKTVTPFFVSYFHVSNNALLLPKTSVLSFSIDEVLALPIWTTLSYLTLWVMWRRHAILKNQIYIRVETHIIIIPYYTRIYNYV